MEGTAMLYVQIAQDYLVHNQPLIPRAGNGLEQRWYTLGGDEVQNAWEEAKRLYEKWKGDTMGRLTARRRLAFIYQRADELEIDLL